MKNRYLPFGYKIADGKIVADSEQVEAVRRIFDAYTAGQLEAAEQIRKSKTVTYSATLKPFRKDMQCGCCGARLYWHSKSNQWFCRECGMWSKPTQAEETFNNIVEKLRWLQQNSELIHPPAGKANVQSMEIVLLDIA